MKKLLFIATVLLSSLAFTACEEEIIHPTTDNPTTNTEGKGSEQTDPGQWD